MPRLPCQVHGDVFRPPRFLEVLAAAIGTGVQLALLVLAVILITIAGEGKAQGGGQAAAAARNCAAVCTLDGACSARLAPGWDWWQQGLCVSTASEWRRTSLTLGLARRRSLGSRHAVCRARHDRHGLHHLLRSHLLCWRVSCVWQRLLRQLFDSDQGSFQGRSALRPPHPVLQALLESSLIQPPTPGSYVSGGFYARNEGKGWIQTMLVTACLFPLSCFGIAFVLNTIAIFYQSLAAVPFGSIVVVLLIWMFISFPLCLFGTVVGRNWAGTPNYPCR